MDPIVNGEINDLQNAPMGAIPQALMARLIAVFGEAALFSLAEQGETVASFQGPGHVMIEFRDYDFIVTHKCGEVVTRPHRKRNRS